MDEREPFPSPLQFEVLSRDGRGRHSLTVARTANGLIFTCTCEPAQRGCLCRHRVGLALGDGALAVQPRERLADLQRLISDTPLPGALQELRRLQRELDLMRRELDGQEKFILGLISN